MKVVIIGGGIAGLTLGALLHDRNIEFSISERNLQTPSHGHAFLMHTDGLAILNELSAEHHIELPGNYLDTYRLSRPDGQEIKRVPLLSWKSIKRQDMLHFLTSLLPEGCVTPGRQFSHFNYKDGRAVEAVFANGEVVQGDLFIGADGSNSRVRQEILGTTTYTPTVVKEMVGIAPNTPSANNELSVFNKFQDMDKGLSFGYIPVSAQELVWFMQYDATANDVASKNPNDMADFCNAQLHNFPAVVKEIVAANNFSTTYIWNTTDFDLLPKFHHKNIVVIGDAAHMALPFTSSGTTNAVIDAKVLADCLDYTTGYEQAFSKFYQLRATEVQKHTELGRQLKKVFLNPEKEAEIPIPLISRRRGKSR
jgi:2-polyprenyl-6-methoxyphenol hydroxylase-like FAD-dependent oxidoreductase